VQQVGAPANDSSSDLLSVESLNEGDPGPSTPHSQDGDDRLKRADDHLKSGRDLYFKGNLAGAHHEFDAAVTALLDAPASLPDHARLERRLEQICDLVYRFDVEKLGAGETTGTEEAFDQAPIDEISHMTFPVDEAMAAKLKGELNRTPSGIPLELSDPVLSFVHYFSTERGRSILLAGLRRSGRYRPLIQKIFVEEGVPEELIYLAQAESGFLPRAISNKRAVGMWQFIPGTGADYDLIRTAAYDERFDPEKATRAAAKYLKDLHARYGDWYLAMAAYNCGAGAVDRAVERTGYSDYWELLKRKALPRETSNYVPIIVAMTIMAKNPLDYGLQNVDLDSPLEYDSIQVSAPTNLNLVADATMQPLSVIRELNPSLIRSVAPAGFQIHVPKGSSEATLASLEIVPAANRGAWRLHHVESGDTLTTIAKAYHLTANSIVAANKTDISLEKGDVVLIPAVWREEAAPKTRRASSSRGRSQSQLASAIKSSKSSTARRGTHISASRGVSANIPVRKAVVRNASLVH
jgi:membrane-bound lytic murein transglycosylase D